MMMPLKMRLYKKTCLTPSVHWHTYPESLFVHHADPKIFLSSPHRSNQQHSAYYVPSRLMESQPAFRIQNHHHLYMTLFVCNVSFHRLPDRQIIVRAFVQCLFYTRKCLCCTRCSHNPQPNKQLSAHQSHLLPH